jgi:hypothetical protein
MLKEAEAAAQKETAAGRPTTTEQVLAANPKEPLTPASHDAANAEAKAHIASGILSDPAFQSARTLPEGRDALSQRLLEQTAKSRAEAGGATGGKTLTKIQFIGDLYADATSPKKFVGKSGKERVNTDVAPDADVAYVIPKGDKLVVTYIGGAKIVKNSAAKGAAADAKTQNAKNKAAIDAGKSRFEVKTRDGQTAWAEVKKVTALENGTKIDVTDKLTMDSSAKLETIGVEGQAEFDAGMKTGDASHLNKVVEAIWRQAEMSKR